MVAAAIAGVVVLVFGFLGVTRAARDTAMVPWVQFATYAAVCVAAVAAMWLTWRGDAFGTGAQRREGRWSASGGSLGSDSGASASREDGPPVLDRFQVDDRGARRLVAASDVVWIEAAGNYARLHLEGESFLYRRPLARLENELRDNFIRTHRSAIVNLDVVRRVDVLPSGDAVLRLVGGHEARLSRRYARGFHERTGRSS